jgi:hypothetical protein
MRTGDGDMRTGEGDVTQQMRTGEGEHEKEI